MRFYRWISWINWHKNKSEDYKSLTESVIIDFPKKFNIYQDKNMLAYVYEAYNPTGKYCPEDVFLQRPRT